MDTATSSHRNPQDPVWLKESARIPALDAFMLEIFSELLPMILSGIMSIYGGLVPLGFTHSNVC